MVIKQVILENFKSYYGKNTFNLKKGLNIVSGKIGTGKTSLFEGFKWILLDDLYPDKSIDAEFILNKKAEKDCVENSSTSINASCTLIVEREGVEFEICRRHQYNNNDGEISLYDDITSISYTDESTGNFVLTEDPGEVDVKLKTLFPPKLRKYLIFTGAEDLDELLDFTNKKTLERAVDQISYLPLFNQLHEVVVEIKGKVDRKYTNKVSSHSRDLNKSRTLEGEIDNKIKELEKNIKTSSDLETEIQKLEISEAGYVEKLAFIGGFPDLQKKEKDLERELKSTLDEKNEITIRYKERFVNHWMLSGTAELYENAQNELSKFREWRNEQIAANKEQLELGVPGDDLINRMLHEKKCLICGSDASEGSDEYKSIESHLDKNKSFKTVLSDETEDLNEKVISLSKNITLLKNFNLNVKEEIKQLLQDKETNHEAFLSTKKKLENVKDEISGFIEEKGMELQNLNPTQIASAYRNVRDTLKTKRSQLEFYKGKKGDLEKQVRDLKAKLEGLTISTVNLEEIPEKIALNYIEEIERIITEKVNTEKKDLILKIQEEANRIQKSIIEASNDTGLVVLYVKIDEDDYSISFTDKDGNPNPGHGAQKDLAKMSIISSVLKLSSEYKGENYPFIVDAPASKFDDTIIKPFIRSVADNFNQGLIILKDIKNELDAYKKEDFTATIFEIEKSLTGNTEAVMTNSSTQIKVIK